MSFTKVATMFNVFAENPLLVSILIGIIVIGLLYGWLQSGDKRLALAGLVCAALIPGAYLVAGAIETDREQILGIIGQTARAVEANQHDQAASVIGDQTTRDQALAELPRYEFHSISVRNIQIKMIEGSSPQQATVDLDASVRASQTQGSMKNIRVPRRLILTFEQQPDGDWLVTDYTHQPLIGGPDGFSPNGT